MIAGLIGKSLKLVIGIALLPLMVTISQSFYLQLDNISDLNSANQTYFLWGVIAYVIMHIVFIKPQFIYNLGHELVHVLATWLSFGRAGNLRVSRRGGSVQTSKSNSFVSISPYFVPIFAVGVGIAYFLISLVADISNHAGYFVFFIAFCFTLHIIMTIEALKVNQPDVVRTGYLFSLSVIYVANIVIAGLILGLVFPGFSFIDMFMQFLTKSKEFYILIFKQLFFI